MEVLIPLTVGEVVQLERSDIKRVGECLNPLNSRGSSSTIVLWRWRHDFDVLIPLTVGEVVQL